MSYIFARSAFVASLLCAVLNGGSWYGALHDDTGRPLAGRSLSLSHDGHLVGAAATDQDGKFRFADLSEGSYSVSLGPTDGAKTAVSIPASDRFELSLRLTSANLLIA